MRVVVVYESMFGNTRQIAQAIADGIGPSHEVAVIPVRKATSEVIGGADLVVVGGPTHVHGMSRPASRTSAGEVARKPRSAVALEPGAEGPGSREWCVSLGPLEAYAAGFDTRAQGSPMVTGRASKRIDRLLGRHGARRTSPPKSFVVTRANVLVPGQADRARRWGTHVAHLVTSSAAEAGSPDGQRAAGSSRGCGGR
jgi:Flavodoxin domain